MVLEAERVHELLRKHHLHHGYVLSNPEMENTYHAVDLWSDPLPISGVTEYSLASKIAEKYNVILMEQDFTPGGMKARYEPVFAVSCGTISELEGRIQNLEQAEAELKKRTEKLVELAME